MAILNHPIASVTDHQGDCALLESSPLGLCYDLYEGLTEREELIAQMVDHGKADYEIAHDLDSDAENVKKEIHQVMDQLNVDSRTALSEVMSYVEI